MAVFERNATANCARKERGVAKATAPGSGGGEGGHIQGFHSVWTPPGDGDLFQIIRAGDLSGGQRLPGGSQKPFKGTGSVAEVYKDYQQGGGGAAGVRIFL